MNMQKMMQELQKMQKKMSKIQGEMETANFEAEAGGGVVKIIMNGKYEVQSIKLAKEAVDPADVEALEDLLLAAFNAARTKVEDASQERMGGLTKGMGIPGL
jgi:DNA-binding YbaB/EbfC family protein